MGVVGSGTMATGIVEVFAKAGYRVTSVARGSEWSTAMSGRVMSSLDKAVQRGKLAEQDRADALARISWSTVLDDLADVDLVVEAVAEDVAVKRDLFTTLDGICKPGVVLATTTSSLPVIECAMATGRPDNVVGLHFFNPAPVMATGRGGPDHPYLAGDPGHRAGGVRPTGQAAGGVWRPCRLRGQRAALPVPQRRGAHGRGLATRPSTTSTTR